MSDDDRSFNPIIAMTVAASDITGESASLNDLKPLVGQYAMGPGDTAVMAAAPCRLDNEVTAIALVDPEEYAAVFPDWVDRIQRGFVLGLYFDKTPWVPDTGELGWFSRSRLIQTESEQHTEMLNYINGLNEIPQSPPQWLVDAYQNHQISLAKAEPKNVPAPIKCGECGKHSVHLSIEHNRMVIADVGILQDKEGQERIVALGNRDNSCYSLTRLVCTDCSAISVLDPGTVEIDANNSELRRILGHN